MENLPIVSVQDARLTETNGQLSFTVTLSEASDAPVTVLATPFGGTAFEGLDFRGTQQTITIPAGETETTFTVETFSDETIENDESVVVELANPDGATFAGDAQTIEAFGLIQDDDGVGTGASLFVSDARVVEGDEGQRTATFDVVLSKTPDLSLTVDYTTKGLSATAGEDFVSTEGSLVFAGGETAKTVEVPINGDGDIEGTESFALVVTPPDSIENATESAVGEARILDDDSGTNGAPTVSLADVRLVESDQKMQFAVSLSETRDSETSLDMRAVDGTAEALNDFAETLGEITIPAGDTTSYATVNAFSDSFDEADERFALELSNPGGDLALAGQAAVLRAQGVLRDDDTDEPGSAVFVDDVRVVEGDSGSREAVFDIAISRPSEIPLTVSYATEAGSATAGKDFTSVTGEVTFAPGQTGASVAVPILGDMAVEGSETFTFRVDSDFAANGAADVAATATILADDTSADVPVATITNTHRSEDTAQVAFTVTLSEPAESPVSIDYATRGGTALSNEDFGDQRGTLEIAAGERTGTIVIEAFTDEADEPDEAFTVELTDAQGATLAGDAALLRARGVIRDDDGESVNRALLAEDVRMLEGDDGQRDAVFDISLSRPLDTAISLPYTTRELTAEAGVDFQPKSGTLNFAVGQTDAAVTVPVFGDRVSEASERFALDVEGPVARLVGSGASGVTATATLMDDDTGAAAATPVPTVTLEGARAIERTGEMAFTVSLSEASDASVGVAVTTVDGTAEGGTDFEAKDDVAVVPVGKTSANFVIRTLADDVAEGKETFTLRATDAIGAELAGGADNLEVTGTIVDDDQTVEDTGPVLSVEDSIVEEPNTGTATLTFPVSLLNAAEQDVTANYEFVSGTARVGGDGADVSAETGTVTIPAGERNTTVTATVQADTITEDAENFLLRLDSPENATFQADTETAFGIGTINANEGDEATFPLLDLTPREQVAAIYTAYFGRAPNPEGLDFWVGELQSGLVRGEGNGQVLTNIASSFAADTDPGEAIALFPFLASPDDATDADIDSFVTDVFQNVFNRDPDPAGLDFWRGQVRDLIDGEGFVGNAIINIVSGARNTDDGADRDTLRNKLDVGLAYAEEVTQRGAAFSLSDDQSDAQAVLADVTADGATVSTALDLVESRVAADRAEADAEAPALQGIGSDAGTDALL